MNKVKETRQRFEEKLGKGVTENFSYQYLRKAGEIIEKLNIDNIDADKAFVKVLEEIKDYEEPKITKANMAGILGVKKRHINNILDNLVAGEEYVEIREGSQEVEYAHPDFKYGLEMTEIEEKDLKDLVTDSYKQAKNILGGYREPTLEEVAKVGNLDFQEDKVRWILHRFKGLQDWTEPSESKVQGWKGDLTKLVGYAAIEASDKIDSSVPEIPGENVYTPAEYAKKNKELIEKVEIKHSEGDFEMMRMPDKLAYFTKEHILFDADLGIDVTSYSIDKSKLGTDSEE